ncbi:MAG: class I SAM-dependent methyltransferase [Planctomycetota bacterium]|jgi:tRNA (cmo5U34)-methyltransferase
MEASASEFFAEHIASYDSLIRRAVPDYDEMLQRLDANLPAGLQRILELGCGTGNFTLRLVARYPEARITSVDAAAEMLELTRRRVAETGKGAGFETLMTNFEEIDLPHSGFDLVASCISLHHVRDKAALFESLHQLLAPGGYFIFADQMAAGSERASDLNWQRWLAFCREEPACSEEEIDQLLAHSEAHDHYAPIYEQMRQLESAGFTEIDCVWRNWMWGILLGRK